MPINVAALLLALYEPIKLAEDLAVVDLISRGRVSYVVGIGYRPRNSPCSASTAGNALPSSRSASPSYTTVAGNTSTSMVGPSG